MNYAFLGMMIPDTEYETIRKNSKKTMQDAANVLQWHLYYGLCENLNSPIHIINVLPIHSWPRFYKKIHIKEKNFNTKYNTGNVSLGFFNIRGIRKINCAMKIYIALKKWCLENDGEKTLFVYTLSGDLLKVITKVKKVFPELKICVIIADLPNMSNLSYKQNVVKKMYSNFLEKQANKFKDCIDFYVLLTKQMAEYLKIEKPYCVVEGIATSHMGDSIKKNSNLNTILYTGTLHRRFGVWNLVEAFCDIPYSNYRLLICGVGDCEDDLNKIMKKDNRIQFLGQLDRKDVLNLQKMATIVVNPRQNIETFTKYSFPSKNLEYLSSGTPLLAYKLDGIPDEYDEYIIYIDSNDKETFTQKMIEVCSLSEKELSDFGENARNFVINNKNEIEQTKKIVRLIEGVLHK